MCVCVFWCSFKQHVWTLLFIPCIFILSLADTFARRYHIHKYIQVLCVCALYRSPTFFSHSSLSLPHSTLGGSGYKFGLGLNFLLLVLHYINCFRTFIPSLFSIALGVYALAWDVLYIVHNWLRSIIWFVYNLTTVKKIYLQLIAWLFFTNLYIISR